MKILILGVGGMLGSTLARYLSSKKGLQVVGSSRSNEDINFLNSNGNLELIYGLDVTNSSLLEELIRNLRPNLIINCVGIIKQDPRAHDPLKAILINSLFPHQLSFLCERFNSRLIHISTDCVFSGRKGGYLEADFCDCDDLYGRSKCLGEVLASANTITLRTSIIGHELFSNSSLLEWFLSQSTFVQGYSRAVFSGLTTLEIAKVIFNFVLPNTGLAGLYHLSSHPIDKYSLLNKIARVYGKDLTINVDDRLIIDRSLDSSKFRISTKWSPPSWDQMIEEMKSDFIALKNLRMGVSNYVSR